MDLQRLNAALTTDESDQAVPYKDSRALWTWGIGDCLETNPPAGPDWKHLLDNGLVTMHLTPAGAQYLADRKVASDAARWATHPWWAALSDARQNALLEMSFQLGYAAVTAWPTFMAALAAGDLPGAVAAGEDTLWARSQTPARAARVLALLSAGVFPS
jgi:GH24 family phage-related lysozyme (muramidase)